MSDTPTRPSRKRDRKDEDDDNTTPQQHITSPLAPSSPIRPDDGHRYNDDEDIEDGDEVDEIQNDDLEGLEDLIEEDDEGEDLMLTMDKDNRRIEQMRNETYETRGVDDQEYEELDAASRREIDAQLNRRDRVLNQLGTSMPGAFIDDDVDHDAGFGSRRRNRRLTVGLDDDEGAMIDDDEAEAAYDGNVTLESLATDIKTESLDQWIALPQVQKTIAQGFKSFLTEMTDASGNSWFGNKIRSLGVTNAESLEVEFPYLVDQQAALARLLTIAPAQILPIFDTAAMEVVELHYPDYRLIRSDVHVRIIQLPMIYNLRDLRESHMNKLVRVSGVVTRRTRVFPQLRYVKFDCRKCGTILGPFAQEGDQEIKVSFCHNCQSRGPFILNSDETVYRNFQRITLQESPGTVLPGRLPRHREVVLLWDLVDCARPGDEIDITGIYRNSYDVKLNVKNSFPVFSTVIDANSVKRRQNADATLDISESDKIAIKKLAALPDIQNRIIRSMAPSIFHHRMAKTAIACALFGGVQKDVNNKHTIRGDINVLMLGDPGTAKSQLLRYCEKTAGRAVFATGQGASAVGLTAAVRKDPVTREWTLEGGALVLADRGMCLIDEFDKMNDHDRTSIHEAMEQQSISISKAGIVTSLRARCSVVAAANPIGGRYNSGLTLSQNVALTEPILSRFDVLCVVRDIVDAENDERMAKFVVNSHYKTVVGDRGDEDSMNRDSNDQDDDEVDMDTDFDSTGRGDVIPQDILRKYIQYARTLQPKLPGNGLSKLEEIYSDLRRESLTTGSVPITLRHLESMLRLSEAFAKMRLKEYVSHADIDRAIALTVDSFVGAQKATVKRQLRRSFRKYTQ